MAFEFGTVPGIGAVTAEACLGPTIGQPQGIAPTIWELSQRGRKVFAQSGNHKGCPYNRAGLKPAPTGAVPLFQQQHLLDRGIWARHNFGDINATTNAAAHKVLRIPLDTIATRRIMLAHELTNLLPNRIVNGD